MKDCFWLVYNRREGAIKSFKLESTAAKWRKKHRPRGTRLVYVCIPGR